MIGMVIIDFRKAFDLAEHTLALCCLKTQILQNLRRDYQLIFFLPAQEGANNLCKQYII